MRKTAGKSAPITTVDAYLQQVPEPARTTLAKVRAVIQSVVPPDTVEYIGYGMPAYKWNGPLIGFAAFAKHCSLFAMHGTAFEAFAEDFKNYKTSKGTVQFPLDKPMPTQLLKKIVKARLAQNQKAK